MITYKSKSQYVDKDTGEIITKQNAIQNYNIIKKEKTIDYANCTTYNTTEKFGTAIINWWNICENKKQLKIKF